MKTRLLPVHPSVDTPPDFPDTAELAALRAWHAGLSTREAVERYLGERRVPGQSSRSVLSRIRLQLATFARQRQREDLAVLFEIPAAERAKQGRAADQAIELLRTLPLPAPLISDDVERWLDARAVAALRAVGIDTLADLTVRVPRRRRWWAAIPGLGQAGARRIEAFFAEHPRLTERARALIAAQVRGVVVPWEQLRLPHEVDGSQGQFRAPRATCVLTADNDYDGRPGLGFPTRIPRNPAGVPQRSRALDVVGDRRTRSAAIVTDHRGCNRLPWLPASTNAARTLGRAGTPAHIRRVAAIHGRGCLRARSPTRCPCWGPCSGG